MAQLQVQTTTRNTSRKVTINHPNAFDALCFRREFISDVGNTLGGLDVLGGEDTPDIDYKELGMAKVLFIDPWQASRVISEQLFANDGRVKSLALIESDVEGDFELEKQDIFYLIFDGGVGLCYEVVGIEVPIGLPSVLSAKRYILNKRDDLDYLNNDEE